MRPLHTTSLAFFIAATNTHAFAQQAVNTNDDYVIPLLYAPVVPVHTHRHESNLESISLAQLSAMRSADIDLSWIGDRLVLPEYNPNQNDFFLNDESLAIKTFKATGTNQRPAPLNNSIRFSVDRNTELRDGNISGNEKSLESSTDPERLPSLAQSEGEYDIYDISLEWDAITAGPVTLSLLSGLKAIQADIGKRITVGGDTSIDSVHRFTAMPMIGSGIRWQINDNFSFSSAALTHPIETGNALIDFNASTDLRISNNVGFVTGYRIIRSSFEVGSVETDLTQEGLFARLEISF